MKKVANFLVDKRHIIFTVFLVLAGISVFLMRKVNLNYDMTKYLPDDSSMKIGMDIMEEEFGEEESSSLRVMFSGLSETEKTEIYDYLSSLKNTVGVDWEADSADYNKDGYTLYVLNSELDAYSDECAEIFDAVTEKYSDKEVYFSGDIDSANEPVVPTYLLIAALLILTVVLFVMSESWFEPVIFFANIAVAVLINMGTNAFLPSVSNLTNSIVPILQLVLSMDYSIILMNRYTQEKALLGNNTDAMKNAVAKSFSSVTSSSLTTFVGLLALVFMSFKIGADMGVALAKGVLISLICIFTVLPSLILMSDKLTTKLRKKYLHIPMGGYAKFTAKFRYVIGVVFVCVFIASAMLKGGTEITYSLETSNKVDEVFPSDNAVVMLYDLSDEAAAQKIATEIEKDENVTSATGYYNTLGKSYSSDELAELVEEMDEGDTTSSMLKLVYYDYYAGDKDLKIKISHILEFLLADEGALSGKMDEESKTQMATFAAFTNEDTINKPLGAEKLAELLGIDEQTVSQLMAMSGSNQMSTKDFVDFLIGNVLSNPDYTSMFGQESAKQLYTLQSVMKMAGMEYTAEEFYQAFSSFSDEIDEDTAKLMYLYYGTENCYDETWTLSLPQLMDYISDDVMENPLFANYVSDNMKESVRDINSQISEGVSELEGEHYGRIIFNTAYAEDSTETRAFMGKLDSLAAEKLEGDCYLIGNSPMSYEMSRTFDGELNKITLITAAAIFIVVALTFRSVLIPLVLVLIVQCGVFLTITFIGVSGGGMYYLALLIVQCILMGATIDYGILYTNYYRSYRAAAESVDVRSVLKNAYDGSMHTILTSSLIVVAVTGILGLTLPDPTVGAICLTLAVGALCATLLILLLLPGVLACVDKLICRKKK